MSEVRTEKLAGRAASGIDGEAFHRPAEEVLRTLEVDPAKGLSLTEVSRRILRYGPNQLRETKTQSGWTILANQFKSVIVLFLSVAVGVSVLNGDLLEAAAIAVVIAINGLMGFVSELQAVRSMEALRKLGSLPATVRREGKVRSIEAAGLVPGDIVLLDGGDVVTADLRLVEASKLQADEAALTGESVPVGKNIQPLALETPLADRANMLFKGTAVTRGSGAGVVVATGMASELGRISSLVDEALDTKQTPLERRLDHLGARLIWLTVGITAVVGVTGILSGRDPVMVLKTSIALAVAAIPEGLPIVATLALARGMWRMAKRNAVIHRLAAVETLGAVSVICTDKTGTLTEGQRTVREIVTANGTIDVTGPARPIEGTFEGTFEAGAKPLGVEQDLELRGILEVAVLCNDASWSDGEAVGDPVEVALLVAGAKAGLERRALLDERPEIKEVAFDPDVKMMATYHQSGGETLVAVKGAPEIVLDACTRVGTRLGDESFPSESKERWHARNGELAASGLRVLAFAEKQVAGPEADPYQDLRFLGFIGMVDPARGGIRDAIAECRSAGIRVVMLTGDQLATARYVSCEVGLSDESAGEALVVEGRELTAPNEMGEEAERRLFATTTFARVTPAQKLDLVRLYQSHGQVVAMTGDGVNDAPALKQADIGIAMGERGTQVAREAADVILRDDAFSTIVEAVRQGRTIFGNIRTFIRYLISCNVSEILVVFLASLMDAPLPILPLQILFLNLVTDVFPALALGLGEAPRRVMAEPPRQASEPILTRRDWWSVGAYGVLIALAVLGALAAALLYLDLTEAEAVTVSFLTLAMAQLWHVFNMRAPGSGIVENTITRNIFVWAALSLCLLLLVAAVTLPGLRIVLATRALAASGWGLAIGMSLVPLLLGQVALAALGRGDRRRAGFISPKPGGHS